jgi:hypothetical protein
MFNFIGQWFRDAFLGEPEKEIHHERPALLPMPDRPLVWLPSFRFQGRTIDAKSVQLHIKFDNTGQCPVAEISWSDAMMIVRSKRFAAEKAAMLQSMLVRLIEDGGMIERFDRITFCL